MREEIQGQCPETSPHSVAGGGKPPKHLKKWSIRREANWGQWCPRNQVKKSVSGRGSDFPVKLC